MSPEDQFVVSPDRLPNVARQIGLLDRCLRQGLNDIGMPPRRRPQATVGTITVSLSGDRKARVAEVLREADIVAKWCNASRDEPLAGYDPDDTLLRFSPHVYNTIEELRDVLAALSRATPP